MKKQKIRPSLPCGTLTGGENSPWGTLKKRRVTGRLDGATPVAFCFQLLESEALPSWNEWQRELGEAFLIFLEKESCKKERDVYFGGLESRVERDGFSLFAAFGPFAERNFIPVAGITLSPDGTILKATRKI